MLYGKTNTHMGRIEQKKKKEKNQNKQTVGLHFGEGWINKVKFLLTQSEMQK